MPMRIRITSGAVSVDAQLNDTPTAQAILEVLPVEAAAFTWGEEVYFDIPVAMDAAPDARAEVEVGELAYWPEGNAFCIFLGPTPASSGDKPVAASPVNRVGRLLGNASLFRAIQHGDTVRVEAVE